MKRTSLPPGERIVAMVSHERNLYVATESRVYKKIWLQVGPPHEVFEPVHFEVQKKED